MTVVKNEDGTFSVTFNARQLELVIGRLGLNDPNSPTDTEEFALYEEFHDQVAAVGVNTNPIKSGQIRFEDLSTAEKAVEILMGDGPANLGTSVVAAQPAQLN